jgi:hypothetical protein
MKHKSSISNYNNDCGRRGAYNVHKKLFMRQNSCRLFTCFVTGSGLLNIYFNLTLSLNKTKA